MIVPRAACFAVTFRVGGSTQPSLPGMSAYEEVVDELLDCLRLYINGDDQALKNRIPEEAYYRNFVGLAQSLKPDGDKVSMVGFTAVRQGKTRQIAFTRNAIDDSVLDLRSKMTPRDNNEEGDPGIVQLRGELQVANARKKIQQKSWRNRDRHGRKRNSSSCCAAGDDERYRQAFVGVRSRSDGDAEGQKGLYVTNQGSLMSPQRAIVLTK